MATFRSTGSANPQQSAATQRLSGGLPPQELLAQCGHYSDKVRRDGLVGMEELLSKHPAELRRHAGPIMERLAERITDTAPGALSPRT